jgi:hypothetical protein
VTAGTITITANGNFVCSYSAGAQAGCSSNSLPAGTDQVQASYSGSAASIYDASSAAATVTVLQVHPPMQQQSTNWAGYAATGETFTRVSATWTVPKANCGSVFGPGGGDSLSNSATWIGIDGDGTAPVEQIGTYSECVPVTTGNYQAWWEMYPGPTHYIGLGTNNYPVSPGDVMRATVAATGVPGQYTLTIANESENWPSGPYTTTQTNAAAPGGSAECIEEQPSLDFGLPPMNLTNFGSVTFNQCMVTGSNGIDTPIADHPNAALTMTDASGATTKATVSPLSNDGKDFTVTWLHP